MKRRYIVHFSCDFTVYGEDDDEAFDNAYELIDNMPSNNPLNDGEIYGIEIDEDAPARASYFS